MNTRPSPNYVHEGHCCKVAPTHVNALNAGAMCMTLAQFSRSPGAFALYQEKHASCQTHRKQASK
eukprot:804473-Amphidinium_carterae.1